MTIDEIMQALEAFGNPSTKRTLIRHGAKDPLFGVKVADLKKILKKTKKNYALSLALYDTGNSDAMYLAGLMADEKQMTKADVQKWMAGAYWYYLSEYTVPWVASETPFGYELALEWIESKEEITAACGWQTLSCWTALKEDSDLDLEALTQLLNRIRSSIHQAPNRVRLCMNAFVIAIGSNIISLTDLALDVAQEIGKVSVSRGDTACKVPLATTYIQKVIDKNRVGKKRKTCRC